MNHRVPISHNRFYNHQELSEILQQLAAAFPELATLTSLGKTFLGRDIWVLTLTNKASGSDLEKPGYYIDAAHSCRGAHDQRHRLVAVSST